MSGSEVGASPLPPGWVEIREGGTELLLPAASVRRSHRRGPAHRAPVFYNPAMSLSRDLHVAFVSRSAEVLGRRLRCWDALSASGVRGARLLKETDAVELLLATDLQPQAVEALTQNLRRADPLRGTVRAADALEVPSEAPFDLVDLDPYGTPMPFLETALAAVRPGGILAVTATDMAVLAGPEREACERRYGARPLRNYLCNEGALRILLASVARLARQKGRSAHPLLSYARDHHIRAYLRIDLARGDGEDPIRSVPFEGYAGPPLLHGVKGGPLWTGPLHDEGFLSGLRPPRSPANEVEILRWTGLLQEEARTDTLFFYASGEVGRALGLSHQPPLARVLETLVQEGWRASRTPMEPAGWRTDAPWEAVARAVLSLLADERR